MNPNLTDITLVVDRSGSMASIRDDAEGGVNSFIEQQAKQKGEALITLVEFDTAYDFVAKGVPAQSMRRYKLVPRGMTALLDAVGRAINETGLRLAKMNENERPGLVIFVVMTDGYENSSREFTNSEIKQMIKHQQEKYNWQFMFLAADQDAFGEAEKMGIQMSGAGAYAKQKVAAAYSNAANNAIRMRKQTMHGQTVVNQFTDEERANMS